MRVDRTHSDMSGLVGSTSGLVATGFTVAILEILPDIDTTTNCSYCHYDAIPGCPAPLLNPGGRAEVPRGGPSTPL
jgi:hypothetical protein